MYIECKDGGGGLGARSKIKYFRFVMIERSVNGKACGQSNSNKLENKELKRVQVKCKSQDKDKKGLRICLEEKANCAIHLQSQNICIAESHYI